MKKIAVPTRDGVVDDHFGHCEGYTIFTIGDEGTIKARETLPSPSGCGCKSNIASVFQQAGVTVMLAGNMGGGALTVLSAHGITVFRGCSGRVQDVVEAYLAGTISDSGDSCHQHADGHHCGH